jgi:hypothetical protein
LRHVLFDDFVEHLDESFGVGGHLLQDGPVLLPAQHFFEVFEVHFHHVGAFVGEALLHYGDSTMAMRYFSLPSREYGSSSISISGS